MDINIPPIVHKYTTLFDTQQEYDIAEPSFEEVNWSAVKDTQHPEETPVPYQFSIRDTHGFEPVDYETVFPDSSVRGIWYTYDHMFHTFFLEIIWGYFGWEWIDYEYTDPDTQETATLSGGNLYKVKEMTEVPSIPDGYRLEHINDFLKYQDKVRLVNWFDTSNLIAVNRAFYNIGRYAGMLEINVTNFPKVKEAAYLYCSSRVHFTNDTLNFPVLENLDYMFYASAYDDFNNLRINAPNATSVRYIFLNAVTGNTNNINVNTVFNDDIGYISDFTGAFSGTTYYNFASRTSFPNQIYFYGNGTTLPTSQTRTIDLTRTRLDVSVTINLSSIFGNIQDTVARVSTNNTIINIDTNNKIILDNAFNRTFNPIINLNNKESLVTSIVEGFSNAIFYEYLPYYSPINDDVNDDRIYETATIYCYNTNLTYDFCPNNDLCTTKNHFNNASIYGNPIRFLNVDKLITVGLGFKSYDANNQLTTYYFDYIIHNSNYDYPDKYRSIVFPLKTILVDQTIYTTNSSICDNVEQFGDNLHIHFKNGVNFKHATSTKTPHLHFSSGAIYDFNIEGENLEDLHLYNDKNGVTFKINICNFTYTKLPSLVNIYLSDGSIQINHLLLTGQYNLDPTSFETFITHIASIDFLEIQQAMFDDLTVTCQTALQSKCSTINYVQEND